MTKQYFMNQKTKLEIIEKRSKTPNSIIEANMKRCELYQKALKEPWYYEYLTETHQNHT